METSYSALMPPMSTTMCFLDAIAFPPIPCGHIVPDSGGESPYARRGFPHIWSCLACLAGMYYNSDMKTITVRLPDKLAAELEAESRRREVSKSEVVRERLRRDLNNT